MALPVIGDTVDYKNDVGEVSDALVLCLWCCDRADIRIPIDGPDEEATYLTRVAQGAGNEQWEIKP